MIEISYAFVAADHKARVTVELADAPPEGGTEIIGGTPMPPPLWTWRTFFSSTGGRGGGKVHDPVKTKVPGFATHLQALTAGVESLRADYLAGGFAAAELEALIAQI